MSMKPTSKIDICNIALDYINQAKITNIDTPSTKIEKLFNRQYEFVKRFVLRMHSWNFANKRVLIPQDAVAPAFGYPAQYELPADYIRIKRIGGRYDYYDKDYEIEDGKLLCDFEAPLPLNYIYDVTDVTKMDPLFIQVLALELALNVGFDINASTTETQRISGLLDEAWNRAKSVDGQESPIRRVERSRFLEARNLGRRRRYDKVRGSGDY